MSKCSFYIDESGTKHPDHQISRAAHNHDWFAFGGILINEEDIPHAKSEIDKFIQSWPQINGAALHSYEIRGAHENFKWLLKGSEVRQRFLEELEQLLLELPVIGLACVIDRSGYNFRYKEKYGDNRWMLCKTAFAVLTERAVKYAKSNDRKLRVFVERSSKKDDQVLKGYYETLKSTGSWFDQGTSAKYSPLTPDDYQKTLYEFRAKYKESTLMQIADLYLWPMCIGGYEPENYSFNTLKSAGKFIESRLSANEILEQGIKYSCFDLEELKNEKTEND